MYGDLVYASPGLSKADIPKYFKDATFGVNQDHPCAARQTTSLDTRTGWVLGSLKRNS